MTNENDLPDEEALEMIATSGPTEAKMIEELLQNNGIECTLQGDATSTPWPTGTDLDEVRIWVKPADAAQAEELVDAFFSPVAKDELEEGESDLGVEDPDEPGGFKF
ncbi:MAG TPA: DUF2007 domain-containing protein [Terriglobia bacterium]|nr:DUF2007 domain-containing protein [Terriglobia bacterium]